MFIDDASFVKSTFEPSVHQWGKVVCAEPVFGCSEKCTRVSQRASGMGRENTRIGRYGAPSSVSSPSSISGSIMITNLIG